MKYLLLLLLFCHIHVPSNSEQHNTHHFVQQGIASWYGPGFQGKCTASGVPYNMYGISCAHRTIPLGTYINIINLSNGKTSRAVVNDRGPYVKPRILDMSLGLKRELCCPDLCKVRISY